MHRWDPNSKTLYTVKMSAVNVGKLRNELNTVQPTNASALLLLFYNIVLQCRHIYHDFCITYDECAVVHICCRMVLDLHMSCKNALSWILCFQLHRNHKKLTLL